jgi:three-Cys-motif partner protein
MPSTTDIGQPPYLKNEEDGLLMREAGPWAAEKLDYLCRYLNIFTTSMRNQRWKGLHFIDLFSGPGKCWIRNTKKVLLGSPLLAVTQQHPFDRYFFVDADQQAIEALKIRCGASTLASNISYQIGDSNQVVTNIVKQIETIDRQYIRGKWSSSLNIAFLDPEGLELDWNTIAILGNVPRMDLIIHYPQMGLSREMPNSVQNPGPTRVDSFFGGPEWREIYQKPQTQKFLHRSLMDLYEGKLKSLGYQEIIENEPLMRNIRRKAPLYRLIFASKHPLGNKFWEQITNRDVYGQAKLC